MAKRKPTSRPRADRARPAPAGERNPSAGTQAARGSGRAPSGAKQAGRGSGQAAPGAGQPASGSGPAAPGRPPRNGRGPLARLVAGVRRFSFVLVLVAAIGGGVALGVMQGRGQDDEGFGDATTTATTEAPFRSNQDDVRGQPAKEVFAHTCGTCHTLRAAGVTGIAGPDLDKLDLSATRVREMIRTGSLDSAMPANLLEGEDAERVARYVARVSRASRDR